MLFAENILQMTAPFVLISSFGCWYNLAVFLEIYLITETRSFSRGSC